MISVPGCAHHALPLLRSGWRRRRRRASATDRRNVSLRVATSLVEYSGMRRRRTERLYALLFRQRGWHQGQDCRESDIHHARFKQRIPDLASCGRRKAGRGRSCWKPQNSGLIAAHRIIRAPYSHRSVSTTLIGERQGLLDNPNGAPSMLQAIVFALPDIKLLLGYK